ncbi:unnamed protein product [Clavelina lepadiformis]|uniref:Uncharacterized protein n=1 Tax=Clavelina lepadiformis TaxID=159417 RepID=A0ABP0GS63_CLALP
MPFIFYEMNSSVIIRSVILAIFCLNYFNGVAYGAGSGAIDCGGRLCHFDKCHVSKITGRAICRDIRATFRCKNNDDCGFGVCAPGSAGSFRCECFPGYAGPVCDEPVPVSPCDEHPCLGDCNCFESCRHEGGRYCVSEKGFIGNNCSIAVPFIGAYATEIVIEVLQDFYKEFDKGVRNSYIYVSPTFDQALEEKCKAFLQGDQYVLSIPLPFTRCGTSIELNDQYITFSNRLWINREVPGSQFDMPVPILDFQCRYQNDYEIVTSLQPLIEPTSGYVLTRNGKFRVLSQLCKLASCPVQCPSIYNVSEGAIYTVGENIHLTVEAQLLSPFFNAGLPPLTSTIQELFLSCDSHPSKPRVVNLALDGCPTNVDFAFHMSAGFENNGQSACISFQLPRVAYCNEVFIHIRIKICTEDQTQICSNSASVRRCLTLQKRSVTDEDNSDEFMRIIGPIYLLEGQEGTTSYTIYPEDGAIRFTSYSIRGTSQNRSSDIVVVTDQMEESFPWIFLTFGLVAMVITILFFVLLRTGVGFTCLSLPRKPFPTLPHHCSCGNHPCLCDRCLA